MYPEIQEQIEQEQAKQALSNSNQNLTTSSSENQTKSDLIKQQWLANTTQKVTCLLICTSFTYEIWVLYKAVSVRLKLPEEIECLFRKQENDVIYFDFVHVNPDSLIKSSPFYENDEFKMQSNGQKCKEQAEYSLGDDLTLKINKNLEEVNSSDDSNYGGVYEGHLPIIGYVKSTYPCNLVIYSLKTETPIHVWRFGSSIIKFESCIKNPSNKAIVLLREGLL